MTTNIVLDKLNELSKSRVNMRYISIDSLALILQVNVPSLMPLLNQLDEWGEISLEVPVNKDLSPKLPDRGKVVLKMI